MNRLFGIAFHFLKKTNVQIFRIVLISLLVFILNKWVSDILVVCRWQIC